MEEIDDDGLPQFPLSPDGVRRMEHLPTVKSSIQYWEAIRAHASDLEDFPRCRVAAALVRNLRGGTARPRESQPAGGAQGDSPSGAGSAERAERRAIGTTG